MSSGWIARLPGSRRVQCPICERHARRFEPFNGRSDAQCRHCKSLERHRQLWLLMQRAGLLERRATIAHFAPEPALEARFRKLRGVAYHSADLEPGRADEVVDVTKIPWPDRSQDMIICAHVLEHVPDDRAAMRELRRVLAPEGCAVIQVPLLAAATDEDPTVTDPEERTRRFGQHDHVRVYGPDIDERLSAAGFRVEHVDVRTYTTEAERVRFGLATHLPWLDPDADALWDQTLCYPSDRLA